MDLKTFHAELLKFRDLKFAGDGKGALDLNAQRAVFQERKYRKLIELAEECGLPEALRKKEYWQRQLEQIALRRERIAVHQEEYENWRSRTAVSARGTTQRSA